MMKQGELICLEPTQEHEGETRSVYASSHSTSDDDTLSPPMIDSVDKAFVHFAKDSDKILLEDMHDSDVGHNYFFRDFGTRSSSKCEEASVDEEDRARESAMFDMAAFTQYLHDYQSSMMQKENKLVAVANQEKQLECNTPFSEPPSLSNMTPGVPTSDAKPLIRTRRVSMPHVHYNIKTSHQRLHPPVQKPADLHVKLSCADKRSEPMQGRQIEPVAVSCPAQPKEKTPTREFTSLLLQSLQKAKQRQRERKAVSVQPSCSLSQPPTFSSVTLPCPSASKSTSVLSRHGSKVTLPARSISTTTCRPLSRFQEIYLDDDDKDMPQPAPTRVGMGAHSLAALKEAGNRARSRSLSSFRGLMRSLSTARQSYHGMSPAAMALTDSDLQAAYKQTGLQKALPSRLGLTTTRRKTKAVNVKSLLPKNDAGKTIIIVGASTMDLQKTLSSLVLPLHEEEEVEVWDLDENCTRFQPHVNPRRRLSHLGTLVAPPISSKGSFAPTASTSTSLPTKRTETKPSPMTAVPQRLSRLPPNAPPPTPPPTAPLPTPPPPPVPKRSSRRPRAITLGNPAMSARCRESLQGHSMPHLLRMLAEAEYDLLAHRSIL